MVGMEWLRSSTIPITPTLVFASHTVIWLHFNRFMRPLGFASLASDKPVSVLELLVFSYLENAIASAGVGRDRELVA